MSKNLVAVTPLAGHANPMLVVSEFLRQGGHEILYNTSELCRERAEARGPRFLPLIGNASYVYHQLGELIPEARTATSHIDLYDIYAKRMFGDRIPDQYRGIRYGVVLNPSPPTDHRRGF
jgi:hypothetical protein